jgi:S-DNA-T family DNA segregation ATPase FtsK/SpoIIIE
MVEMAAGEPLFDEFVYGRPLGDTPWQTEMAEMLEDAVHSMRERAEQLRGRTRKHTPNTDQPLIVIVIDEIASLTAYITDPALRHRITDALSLLLSQGRALGITVIAATQDPAKRS